MSEEAPTALPSPTNQGESSLCTRHALGNAVVNAGEKQGINFPLKSAIDVLVNRLDDPNVEKGAFPEQFNTQSTKPFVLQDESTDVWYYVDLQVTDYNGKDDEFLLVFDVPGGGIHARHCVFIEKLVSGMWSCINSWGAAVDPFPQIPVNKPGNVVYKVVITLRDARIKDVLAAVKAAHESGGEEAVKKITEEHLNRWKFQNINIAVTGGSGVGKSTLINTLRGLEGWDVGAAKINVKETTMKPVKYRFPDNPKIKVWDLPGSGSNSFPKEQYFEKIDELLEEVEPGMKFDHFDALIAMSATRFTETDHFLADHVDVIGKPLFFVRSKVDQDILSMQKAMRQAPEITLRTIREDCEENLQKISKKEIFYISGMFDDRDKWDYNKLHSHIVNCLEDLQKDAFLFSIQAFSEEMVREKKAALETRIPWRRAAWWAVYVPAFNVKLLTEGELAGLVAGLPAALSITLLTEGSVAQRAIAVELLTSATLAGAGALAEAAGHKKTGAKLSKAADAVWDGVSRAAVISFLVGLDAMMLTEVKFQREQLGIGEKAVANLATDTGKTEQQIGQDIDISTGPRTCGGSKTRPASDPYDEWHNADLSKELSLNETSALKKLELQKNFNKNKM